MITITEALAECKTIDKRIEKKIQFVVSYLLRQEQMKDPLEKDGGSVAAIKQELQSLHDLAERKVAIRMAIGDANGEAVITSGPHTRSIAEWLVWRREAAPVLQKMWIDLRNRINATRETGARQGIAVGPDATKPTDIIVNVNEIEMAHQIEALEEILGTLDGQLSLKNATVMVDV